MWEATLVNESYFMAREVLNEISVSLRDMNLKHLSENELCEQALVFAYRDVEEPRFGWREYAIGRLQLAISMLSSKPPVDLFPLSLFGGLSGCAWVIEHVSVLFGEEQESSITEGDQDALEDVDQLILDAMEQDAACGLRYDLMSGFVGIGVYWLERYPRKTAIRGIQLVLEGLECLSEVARTDIGLGWLTPPGQMSHSRKRVTPDGCFYLGIANGVSGIIGFLAQVVQLAIAESVTALRLLEQASAWLLAQECHTGAPTRFGAWVAPDKTCEEYGVGWADGELGIAAALRLAGKCVQRHDWVALGTRLIDNCLSTSVESFRISGPSLGHGAFGVAHIYNREYQSDKNPSYRAAAQFWFSHGLRMLSPRKEIGGYGIPLVSARKEQRNSTLINGEAGVALALLAATSRIRPRWDRLLLLSSSLENFEADAV